MRNHITVGLLIQFSSVFRFSLKFLSIPFPRGIVGCNKLSGVWVVEVFWLSALFQVVGAEKPCGTHWCCVPATSQSPWPGLSLLSSLIQMLEKPVKMWIFLLNLHSSTFCFAWNDFNFVPGLLVSGLMLHEGVEAPEGLSWGGRDVEWVKRVCWLLLLGVH